MTSKTPPINPTISTQPPTTTTTPTTSTKSTVKSKSSTTHGTIGIGATAGTSAAAHAPLSELDYPPIPAPSLLHYEPPTPGQNLSRSTLGLCGILDPPHSTADSDSDSDDEDMPDDYQSVLQAHVITPVVTDETKQKYHPIVTAAIAATNLKHTAGRSQTEVAHERAERFWQQQQKWSRMLREAGEMESAPSTNNSSRRSGFVYYASTHMAQVRRLISRGVPACYRGFIWQQVSGSSDQLWRSHIMQQQFQLKLTSSNQQSTQHQLDSASVTPSHSSKSYLSDLSPIGAYHRILSENGSSPLEEQIIKDLNRTFPKQVFFKDRCGMGQNSFFHVLKAYSFLDPSLGYCQGMGYIVAGLLQYMCEEDAFWLLVCLLHHPRYGGLRGLFLESMPKLNSLFYLLQQILAKDLPKLTAHFQASGMHLSMFSSTWFMTLYAGAFTDFENVSRIWDVLMYQGVWFLLKVSVGVLKNAEKSLLMCNFEHSLAYLKYLQSHITADQLIEQSLLVTLDYAECERWELEFEREQKVQRDQLAAYSAMSVGNSTGHSIDPQDWNQEPVATTA